AARRFARIRRASVSPCSTAVVVAWAGAPSDRAAIATVRIPLRTREVSLASAPVLLVIENVLENVLRFRTDLLCRKPSGRVLWLWLGGVRSGLNGVRCGARSRSLDPRASLIPRFSLGNPWVRPGLPPRVAVPPVAHDGRGNDIDRRGRRTNGCTR